MKKNSLLLVAVSSFALFGCSSLHMDQPSSSLENSAVASPSLQADVTVGNKISGTATATQIFGLIYLGPNKFADGVNYSAGGGIGSLLGLSDPVKAAAAYEAVTSSHADIIIAPRYTIETVDYMVFKSTTATVSGYKGTINGISTITNTPKLESSSSQKR